MLPRVCSRLAWAAALIVLPAFMAAGAPVPAPTYEKSAEVSVKGTILSIVISADDSVYLRVRSRGKTLNVYVAPQRFLKFVGIIYKPGEKVEIVGSRVTSKGAPLVLARTIKRPGQDVTLRNADGTTVWNGWLP